MKDRTRRKWKRWLRKNRKYVMLGAGVVLLVALVVLAVNLYLQSDRVGHALKSKRYENVQMTITRETTTIEVDESGESIESTSEDVIKLQKDGTTYYENSNANEYYQYELDGKMFLLYYDDFYGIKAENGDWVEVLVAEEDSPLSFDFSIFENYKKSDFQKVEDYYVPKNDASELFLDITQVGDDSKYYSYDMKFYFEQGKLVKIVVSYNYAIEMEVITTYEFSYKDETITVPEADVKYEETKTE